MRAWVASGAADRRADGSKRYTAAMRWLICGVVGCSNGAGGVPVIGANLPWINYGHDFGRAWGNQGIATAAARERLDADLSDLAGVDVVRWFVYADGRALGQSTRAEVFADMDAALEVADAHQILVMPVLFDFLWFDPAVEFDGVQMFGRTELAVDPTLRAQLIADWVAPFAERYADDERIYAIDLINEPEWAMLDVGVPAMDAFLEDVAAPFWDRVPVTVGSASFQDVREHWVDCGLDLLQVHHYGIAPLRPAARLGASVPVWVGEYPTFDTDLWARHDAYGDKGYDGVMPWSLNATDEATDRAALVEWLTSP